MNHGNVFLVTAVRYLHVQLALQSIPLCINVEQRPADRGQLTVCKRGSKGIEEMHTCEHGATSVFKRSLQCREKSRVLIWCAAMVDWR